MSIPRIDGIQVELGDVVTWGNGTDLCSQLTQAVRVKGWSASGDRLSLGWCGNVPTSECSWYTQVGTGDLRFALLYRPSKTNDFED